MKMSASTGLPGTSRFCLLHHVSLSVSRLLLHIHGSLKSGGFYFGIALSRFLNKDSRPGKTPV